MKVGLLSGYMLKMCGPNFTWHFKYGHFKSVSRPSLEQDNKPQPLPLMAYEGYNKI